MIDCDIFKKCPDYLINCEICQRNLNSSNPSFPIDFYEQSKIIKKEK